MTLQEKYDELIRIMRDKGLEYTNDENDSPPPQNQNMLFIVADNTSNPIADFQCYAKLESDS